MNIVQIPGATRSWLFTPATRPERFANALECGADVLIVDLEDAVPPAQKAVARANVRALLDSSSRGELLPLLAIRINSSSCRFGLKDLLMLLDADAAPDFVLLPKIESPEQVAQVESLLEGERTACQGPAPQLVPLIESARGLAAVGSIARAGATVAAVMFGAADYAAEIGAQPDALTLQVARCEIAAGCAQAGIPAIDAPCFAVHDPKLLEAELTFAGRNGFKAKAAIHPLHVDAINAAFTPTPERVAWARRVIEASEQGVGTVDGRMVDAAIAREAWRIIGTV